MKISNCTSFTRSGYSNITCKQICRDFPLSFHFQSNGAKWLTINIHHRLIIPRDLISETFDMLSLLIPRQICNVQQYLKKQQSSSLDPGALYCEYLNLEDRQIEHFKYWGDRLVKLKQVYDNHEPHGPFQWWRDDRKEVQWWTFWVAVLVLILTIVFGAIQSVTAIIQAVK